MNDRQASLVAAGRVWAAKPRHHRLWLVLPLLGAISAQAQVPSNPYNYERVSSFSYRSDGLLQSETIEPDRAQLCVATAYTYDAYGNKTGASTANCAGATGLAQITPRASGTAYAQHTGRKGSIGGATIPVPAGAFATSATNALSQAETRTYDPRFGAVVELIGPNALATRWTLDDFGRKVLEVRADGTRTAMYYCWLAISVNGITIDTGSNSPGCHNGSAPAIPAPVTSPNNEVPADAVRYEHSVLHNAGGSVIGAFSRVYYDRAGRKIRSVTQAFDGANQPGGTARLVVADTDHNAYGTPYVVTQPYFLDSGSSTTGGSNNVGLTRTDVDALGRPTATYSTDPATGSAPNYPTGGAVGGSQSNISFGNRGSHQATQTTITYQGLVSVTTNDKGHARTEEKNLEGKVVRVTDALGAQLVHQHDAFGNLVKTKDALGNISTIVYDYRGRKVSLDDPDAGVTAYCYDALGQLKAQQSSNQRGGHGASTCPTYSGAGSTVPGTPPATWTHLAYDVLGRMTHRVEPEYTTSWTYDSCTKGVGKLCQTSTSHGVTRKLVYDSLGRPINTRTDVTSGPSAASAVTYDTTTGRVASQTYPTGVKVNYQYTARGFMSGVVLDTAATITPLAGSSCPGSTCALSAGTVLWSAVAVNAWGKSEQHNYANGIANRAAFEPRSGRLLQLNAGTSNNVVDQRYVWDSINLLTRRVDGIGDASVPVMEVLDTFAYDALGRLTQYQVSGGSGATPSSRTVDLQYNALGLLLAKSDVGNYSYPTQGVANGRPHAVQSITGIGASYTYDLNGNAVAASAGKWRTITYTSFNLPGNVPGDQGIDGPGGTPRAIWQYDENHQRIKEVRSNAQGTRTTWFLHPDNQGGLGFEREIAPNGTQSNRHYLSAGGMAFAVLVTTGALPTLQASDTAPPVQTSITAVKLEYWHKDQLGSLIATTDHAGAVTDRYAYDPYGKRRYTTGTYDAFGNLIVDWTTDTNKGTDRGFTGHEHLDDLGLIHMNGRVFDPTIGRFLQADPFVQDPYNLLNFDRYGYCFGSPMVCTDPSGYFSLKKFLRAIVAIAAAVLIPPMIQSAIAFELAMAGVAANTAITASYFISAAVGGFVGGAIATGSMKGALQGAFSAAMFVGAGELIHGAGIVNEFAQVAVHGVTGCVTSVASGGKCGPGMLSASFAKAVTFAPGMKDISAAAKGGSMQARFVGALIHAVVGGTASALGGGKFANGAQSGAFGYLFNCLNHEECTGRPAEEHGRDIVVGDKISVDTLKGMGVAADVLSLAAGIGEIRLAMRAGGEIVGYFGYDSAGLVRYVGITVDEARRFADHLAASGTGRDLLRYQVAEGAQFMTRLEARIWEQTQIIKFGLQKSGGQLLNLRNEIAKKYWDLYGIK
jgi:RHS repeat-associated protein